jgi:hypothetical protein
MLSPMQADALLCMQMALSEVGLHEKIFLYVHARSPLEALLGWLPNLDARGCA